MNIFKTEQMSFSCLSLKSFDKSESVKSIPEVTIDKFFRTNFSTSINVEFITKMLNVVKFKEFHSLEKCGDLFIILVFYKRNCNFSFNLRCFARYTWEMRQNHRVWFDWNASFQLSQENSQTFIAWVCLSYK